METNETKYLYICVTENTKRFFSTMLNIPSTVFYSNAVKELP